MDQGDSSKSTRDSTRAAERDLRVVQPEDSRLRMERRLTRLEDTVQYLREKLNDHTSNDEQRRTTRQQALEKVAIGLTLVCLAGLLKFAFFLMKPGLRDFIDRGIG